LDWQVGDRVEAPVLAYICPTCHAGESRHPPLDSRISTPPAIMEIGWARLLERVGCFSHFRTSTLDITHVYTHAPFVRYSFDPVKRAGNLEKHGLDFADAWKVIESGQTVTFEDRRLDYSEERFVTLGPLGESLVAIVTAETDDHIRIISMRKANRHEQAIYRENLI
jgi:hypothetical protein